MKVCKDIRVLSWDSVELSERVSVIHVNRSRLGLTRRRPISAFG